MIDQIFDRHYQDARARMNREIALGLGLLGSDILRAFEALSRLQFAAPWSASRRSARHH